MVENHLAQAEQHVAQGERHVAEQRARVEALAGPQGTLYGASSEAGTIRIITNKPQLGVTSGRIDGELNSIDHGGIGGKLEGMINLPIAPKIALSSGVGGLGVALPTGSMTTAVSATTRASTCLTLSGDSPGMSRQFTVAVARMPCFVSTSMMR